MTAGERLRALAGVSGTAGALLLMIGTGATSGAILVDYSQLPTGTATQHLLVDRGIEHHGDGKKHHHKTGWEDYVAPRHRKTLKQYKNEYLKLSSFEIEEIKLEAQSEIRYFESEIRSNIDLGLQDVITKLKLAISIQKVKLDALAWVEQERFKKARIVEKLQNDKNLDADLVFITTYLMDNEED